MALKGSTIRVTPPGDTHGSDRQARPSVRQAHGSSHGPPVLWYRRVRPSAVPDVVSPGGSGQRRSGARARGADARRSGDGRGTHGARSAPVSYTHLRAHETVLDLVCRLLLEK